MYWDFLFACGHPGEERNPAAGVTEETRIKTGAQTVIEQFGRESGKSILLPHHPVRRAGFAFEEFARYDRTKLESHAIVFKRQRG